MSRIFFLTARLVRWRNDDNFYLIYGIPYDTDTGQNNFKVTDKDYKILKNININVKDKEFKIQKIKVNKKYVELVRNLLKK